MDRALRALYFIRPQLNRGVRRHRASTNGRHSYGLVIRGALWEWRCWSPSFFLSWRSPSAGACRSLLPWGFPPASAAAPPDRRVVRGVLAAEERSRGECYRVSHTLTALALGGVAALIATWVRYARSPRFWAVVIAFISDLFRSPWCGLRRLDGHLERLAVRRRAAPGR